MLRVLAFTLAVGWGFAIAAPARASQVVLGNLFMVKDPKPGVDVSHRRIVVVGRGTPPGSTNLIVGDPTGGGATVKVVANGGPYLSQTQTYPLPAAGWKRTPTNPANPLVGYKYTDAAPGLRGPVRSAVIKANPGKPFLIKIIIVGSNGPGPQPHVRVVPPNPGTSGGAILSIQGGDSYCINLGGPAGGKVNNKPTTPPQTKLFRVTSTATEPATDAGCIAADLSCEIVDPESGAVTLGTARPGCTTLAGEPCLPPSGAAVLGGPSDVPAGTEACCCSCVDVNTGALCKPDPSDPSFDPGNPNVTCICASECVQEVDAAPPAPLIDRFAVSTVPCGDDRSIAVEGYCPGVREVLFLTPASGQEQRGQPSGVCTAGSRKAANKIGYLRDARTGMASPDNAPLSLCPFDASGEEITENFLRTFGSVYTLIAPRASYLDPPDDDLGCDTCASACMAAVCDGTGDASAGPMCPGPDGVFGSADDGVSSCDVGTPGALRQPDGSCFEGACGSSSSGVGLLRCSASGVCECGGWLQPCCGSGTACEAGKTCVGGTPGFCVLCGEEGLPCCAQNTCPGNPALASLGPHGAGSDGTESDSGLLYALKCDTSGGQPGLCRVCGDEHQPCCPVPGASTAACSTGLTCDAGWCVGPSTQRGLCVGL